MFARTGRPHGHCTNLVIIAAAAAMLAGCSNARETFGLVKTPPDEFAVVTRAPLKLPPDFRLRPPEPGAQRPQEGTVRESARAILVGAVDRSAEESNGHAATTQGEAALLAHAGATDADPSIRQRVDAEAMHLAVEDDGFLRRLLFWQESPPPGQIVDASREAKRIQENVALGESVSKGAVPVIRRREKGWLEGIF